MTALNFDATSPLVRALPLLLLAAACGGADPGAAPDGVRVVTGRLLPPDAALFSRMQVALQFAAVALDARESSPLVDLHVGPAFNPGANGGQPVTFNLALPADQTFVLFFQVPVDSGQRLGRLAARITFAKNGAGDLATLLPGRLSDGGPVSDLDLGVVNIESVRASEGMDGSHVATLGSGGSSNPLAQNDVDGDGVPDVDDADDDDDLVPDEGDTDANGDDVPDDQQTLEALQDDNANDVPDLFE